MKKIRAAIVGYGNIGKYVLESLQAAPDFEIAGIVRRNANDIPSELKEYELVDCIKKLKDVHVAILATPTRSVEAFAKDILAMGINTVDSFDIHGEALLSLYEGLETVSSKSGSVSIISAGWDPGSDSIVRALMEAIIPKGITYTNFGPGMSMGHSVVAKSIEGVKDALSMTIPVGTGSHRRMVYVELEENADFKCVEQAIMNDDYFRKDHTIVSAVEDVRQLIDMGHGVLMERKGVSGKTHNQLVEFKMKINNPALTAQIMIACARATMKQKAGCYTMLEVPVINLLPGDKRELIKRLA